LTPKDVAAVKGLIALTPEMDCNLTAIGLPPVTSAVFLIAKSFGKIWTSLGCFCYPFRNKT
jgi:hypothetical protein